VQVRDSKYDGDPRWVYSLLITGQPFASHVYPMAAKAGSNVALEPVGSASKVKAKVNVTAPAKVGIAEVVLDTGSGKTNPVPLIVRDLEQVREVEPNDTHQTATRITLPCGINGRIGKALDVDHFVFTAKKGVALRFEVQARRFGTLLRSGLDSTIEILN